MDGFLPSFLFICSSRDPGLCREQGKEARRGTKPLLQSLTCPSPAQAEEPGWAA